MADQINVRDAATELFKRYIEGAQPETTAVRRAELAAEAKPYHARIAEYYTGEATALERRNDQVSRSAAPGMKRLAGLMRDWGNDFESASTEQCLQRAKAVQDKLHIPISVLGLEPSDRIALATRLRGVKSAACAA
jgi:hypothetical protein